MNNWNRMPDALKDQVFEHLARLAAVANLSEENRIAYDKALDRYRVSEIVDEDNRRIATEQGLKEGLQKGLQEGLGKAKSEIALQMKKDGMPYEMIAKYTGLSLDNIDSLVD